MHRISQKVVVGLFTGLGRGGPADERLFFQRAGPAHEGGFFFPTGRTGPTKREMSFLTAGSDYKKKRKTNNISSQSGPAKRRRSFQTGG